METENKDWKPEVGKTAWLKRYSDKIEQVMITADYTTKLHYKQMIQIGEGEVAEYYSAQDRDYFFESPEAALASIKIYDLEGKEVVIPRARPVFNGKDFNWMLRDELGQHEPWIDKLKKGWEVFEAYKASKGAQKPWDEVESRALRIMFTDEAGMLNYSWEQCLAMARREIGGGAAIGGKSDAREGGC